MIFSTLPPRTINCPGLANIHDLPPEEADEIDRLCRDRDLGLIYFLAPTSTAERLKLVAEKARGFIYLVSLTGVTGTRTKLSDDLGAFVDRVRHATLRPGSGQAATPIAIGFGVSTPEQAGEVSRPADGVIVAQVARLELLKPEERLDPAMLMADLKSAGKDTAYLPDADAIVRHLATKAEPGDVVVVFSNGGFGGIHGKLLERLGRR